MTASEIFIKCSIVGVKKAGFIKIIKFKAKRVFEVVKYGFNTVIDTLESWM